ncbi:MULTISPECIES: hypothetical protein [unclassified Streptomyces]|uniref:hypothetical protein n=1 Tax=unclassified Streptomyces TaxID=2593676 RepID=UPI002DDA7A97|nr:hypothetical protein [Streptomyces sp. NBC_01750]WSB04398.1 hypothetical protein OIE54_37205 [Streptomyces sp. NBC_01794]WSD31320.1 hypothetical protein OG966_04900 [Streptomyces sp. NBC_01750]
MTRPPDEPADPLEPARAELRREAEADAAQLLAEAHKDAADTLAAARAEAAEILDRARREGEADGASAAAEERTRARATARALELAAQGETYRELHRRVVKHVQQSGRDSAPVQASLQRRARSLLGPEARITAHADGGVVAVVSGRRADLSLTALATRALDRASTEAESLWAP